MLKLQKEPSHDLESHKVLKDTEFESQWESHFHSFVVVVVAFYYTNVIWSFLSFIGERRENEQ